MVWRFWMSLVVVMGVVGSVGGVAHAKTVDDYRREAEAARVEADRIQKARADAAWRRAEEKRVLRDQKEREKQALVESARRQLRVSGERKAAELQRELEWIQHQKSLYERINASYVVELGSLRAQAEVLVRKLTQEYRQLDEARKASLRAAWVGLREATRPEDIILIKQNLDQLRKNELSESASWIKDVSRVEAEFKKSHGQYLLTLRTVQTFLEKYRVPKLSLPVDTVQKLEHARQYAQLRGEYFAEQSKLAIARAEEQMEEMVVARVDQRMSLVEKKEMETELGIAFDATVGELNDRYTRLTEDSVAAVGCGQRLKPFFSLFTEVVSHQALCADLEQLNRSNSLYYTGCQLLVGLLHEAKDFLDGGAKSQIDLTVALGRFSAPEEIRGKIAALAEGVEERTLAQSIGLHDEVIKEWGESVLGEGER